MAKYQVGQRVRIKWVRHTENQHLVGLCSHIREVDDTVDWDKPENEGKEGFILAKIKPSSGAYWVEDQLEPIIPDGAKPSEFVDIADLLNSLMLNEVLLPEEPDWGSYNDGDDDESRG